MNYVDPRDAEILALKAALASCQKRCEYLETSPRLSSRADIGKFMDEKYGHHSILQLVQDIKSACDGSCDPWPDGELKIAREVLVAVIKTWDVLAHPQWARGYDSAVRSLVDEAIIIAGKVIQDNEALSHRPKEHESRKIGGAF